MSPNNLKIASAFILVMAVIALGTVFSDKSVEDRYKSEAESLRDRCARIQHECNIRCANDPNRSELSCTNECKRARQECIDNPPSDPVKPAPPKESPKDIDISNILPHGGL